jgi:DNA-directed RNA polymerase alpha subunit
MSAKKTNTYLSNIKYPKEKEWDKTKSYVEFELGNVDLSMVNSLRRAIYSYIECFAFRTHPINKNDVNIIKNDSKINNEIIKNRLGLIPIHITDTKFKIEDYEFIIDISKEINSISGDLNITSKDIKILKIKENKYLDEKERENIFPKDPLTNEYILITKILLSDNIYKFNLLYDNNKLNLNDKTKLEFKVKAKAVLSNGKEHAKWMPSCKALFCNKINEKIANETEKVYIKEQLKLFKEKNLEPLSNSQLKKRFETSLKERCFLTNDEDEPIEFIFKIETVGVYPPLIIFYKSLISLIYRLKELILNFKNKNDNIITISPSDNLSNGFKIEIKEENDTLGNMINSHLYNLFIDKELDYIGYKKIHPLQEIIVFNIKSSKYTKEDDFINNIMVKGCENIVIKLNKIKNELEKQKEFISELKDIK